MHTTTVVIGAGHSGLAASRCLSDLSIDHVVLERNEVANSWRRERWDSLRLLTPNWQCRLPGYAYEGDDPDGARAADTRKAIRMTGSDFDSISEGVGSWKSNDAKTRHIRS